jgi:hypothetical protein
MSKNPHYQEFTHNGVKVTRECFTVKTHYGDGSIHDTSVFTRIGKAKEKFAEVKKFMKSYGELPATL